jgi:ferric-dicitrate binding protein FerR (iron transport regulator)
MINTESHDTDEYINLWQITHPAFNPSDIDVEKAEAAIRKKIRRKDRLIMTAFLYWQRIAAVLIIPFIALSAYLYQTRDVAECRETGYQVIKSPYGVYSQINLPDASKVWLNGGTELKYPMKFTPGKRLVYLDGEAYFEVTSDAKNPFVVQTNQMELTATGTKFNIEAYADKTQTAVTMVSGKVDVAFGQSPPIPLAVGTRTCYDGQTGQRTLEQTNPYKWYAWKDGLMIFRDDSLGYVFNRLEQAFNVKIVLRDPTLSNDPYRATFEEESLDEIIRLLEMTAPIKFIFQKRSKTTNGYYEKQKIDVYRI